MIIFYIADIYLRSGGGMPNVIRNISAELCAKGHEVHVLTFSYDDSTPSEEIVDGVFVHTTPMGRFPLIGLLAGYRAMQQLVQQVAKQYPPDLVHVQMPYSGLAAMSQLPNIPVVYTYHGSWADESALEVSSVKRYTGLAFIEYQLMKWIEKAALSKATSIITLSQFMQNSAKTYAPTPSKGWEIIPSGVDLKRFQPISVQERATFRHKHGIPEDAFFLFCSRRLARRMGLDLLVSSMQQIKQEIPNAFLVIGGKGELHVELQQQIESLHLQDFVRLEGFIPEDDFPLYFASADLFVLPTMDLEGFGLINLESFASGTPVLGTPAGAIPEVITPFDPRFVLPSISADAIALGVIWFYRTFMDSASSETIREHAREYASQFEWTLIANRYERIYQEVINHSN